MNEVTKDLIDRKADFVVSVIQGHDRETEIDGRDCSRGDLMYLLHRSPGVNTKAICHYLLTGELRRVSAATWFYYYIGTKSVPRLRNALARLTGDSPESGHTLATQAGQYHLDDWAICLALSGLPKSFPFTTDYRNLVAFLESELQSLEVSV